MLKLGGSKGRTITVRVQQKGRSRSYELPLRGSLKMGDLMLFRAPRDLDEADEAAWGFDAFYEFVGRYLPKDVVDDLMEEDFLALYREWDRQSDEEGVTQGE